MLFLGLKAIIFVAGATIGLFNYWSAQVNYKSMWNHLLQPSSSPTTKYNTTPDPPVYHNIGWKPPVQSNETSHTINSTFAKSVTDVSNAKEKFDNWLEIQRFMLK